MRTNALAPACALRQAEHDPRCRVAVEPTAGDAEEDRPLEPITDRQIERPGRSVRERDDHDHSTLAASEGCLRRTAGHGPSTDLRRARFPEFPEQP